jgi:hypothetical protein
MRLLASVPLALLGSLLGSALRSGLQIAEARLDADPDAPAPEMDLAINGSLLAGLAGGITGLLFGSRTAFWTGVTLGSAGIDRFDRRLLGMAGVDLEGIIARAKSMAEQAQARVGGDAEPAGTQDEEAGISNEPPATEPA